MKFYFFSLLIFGTFGCALPSLTEQAKNIGVLEKIDDLNEYENIIELECSFGCNARSLITNTEACINALRNEASRINATNIFILTRRHGPQYFCPNHIEIHALALKKKHKE